MPKLSSILSHYFFFFNDTATTEIYTLSLHDALPISPDGSRGPLARGRAPRRGRLRALPPAARLLPPRRPREEARVPGLDLLGRSEEHTSELQSQSNLVCRLLLEKKKNKT